MYGTSLFPYKAYCKFQDVSRSIQNLFKYICTVQAIHEQTLQQNKYLIQNHKTHKMVKHTQTICRQFAEELFECV